MNLEVLLVFIVLAVTIALFVAEEIRVDVIAILIMVTLPWLGLVTAREAISGFASNAVVSIIAVMILGYGVDRTGLIADLTAPVLVAISASNSFVLPTHQVNALLMGPGGYCSRDYLRAGGLMSLIFFAVAVGFVYLFYLG